MSLLSRFFCLSAFLVSFCAQATSLDEVFRNFRKCDFEGFYYAQWDPQYKVHPYLAERSLTPYKEVSGAYYFKVKDTLFDIPVSEIIMPGTWNLHAVVFDAPLAKTQKIGASDFLVDGKVES